MDLDIINFEDMEKGDVLLMEDATSKLTHFAIAFAQAVISHRYKASSNVTHAGIYDGQGNIMEAAGAAGLRKANL